MDNVPWIGVPNMIPIMSIQKKISSESVLIKYIKEKCLKINRKYLIRGSNRVEIPY